MPCLPSIDLPRGHHRFPPWHLALPSSEHSTCRPPAHKDGIHRLRTGASLCYIWGCLHVSHHKEGFSFPPASFHSRKLWANGAVRLSLTGSSKALLHRFGPTRAAGARAANSTVCAAVWLDSKIRGEIARRKRAVTTCRTPNMSDPSIQP